MRRLPIHASRSDAARPPGRLAAHRAAPEGGAQDARTWGAGAGEALGLLDAPHAPEPVPPAPPLAPQPSPLVPRRPAGRPPQPEPQPEPCTRASPADASAHAAFVEIRPAHAVEPIREAWLDLGTRSLEPHPFCDPDLVLAAAKHLPWTRRPGVLLVWESRAGREPPVPPAPRPLEPFLRELGQAPTPPPPGRLLAVLPLGLASPLLPNGTPLLDRERAAEALDLALAHLGQSRQAALHLRGVEADGPVAALLEAAALARGTRLVRLNPHRRAALRPLAVEAAPPDAERPAPARPEPKNLARLRRRLAERGALDGPFPAAPGGRAAIEAFLALEAAGWKGRAGTALLGSPGTAGFARAALRSLAERDALRVAQLTLDGRVVAAGAVLRMGPRAAFWKIAHDEALAAFSPGALLTLDLRRVLAGHGRDAPAPDAGDAWTRLELVDSCAVEDHPMIDRLWPDRIAIADFVVPTGAADGRPRPRFALSVALLRGRRALRQAAKRLRSALRRGGRPA